MTSTHSGLASAHLNSVQHTAQYLTVAASVHRSAISINSPSQPNSGKRSLWSCVAASPLEATAANYTPMTQPLEFACSHSLCANARLILDHQDHGWQTVLAKCFVQSTQNPPLGTHRGGLLLQGAQQFRLVARLTHQPLIELHRFLTLS